MKLTLVIATFCTGLVFATGSQAREMRQAMRTCMLHHPYHYCMVHNAPTTRTITRRGVASSSGKSAY
jgi:hypothetical protein